MGPNGEVDKTQITAANHDLVKDDFDCEERGMIDIKGNARCRSGT
jgi:hypothetical protein